MTPDFGDKESDFGGKMKILVYARILVVSLVGTELWETFEMILCDIASRGINPEGSEIFFGVLVFCLNVFEFSFGVLFALQVGQLLK
ncbi:hypothetical protein AVEN_46150-1 [Araneus ventricosus]|uniref:Uncharacterized protein n=1 Tax=Araneus ventricosus TaxID=182803 RepID=A0A4Y2D7G1_ARAVE|nr:hypothetical protein AVEN_46150-1 [Araneus ventricosus]